MTTKSSGVRRSMASAWAVTLRLPFRFQERRRNVVFTVRVPLSSSSDDDHCRPILQRSHLHVSDLAGHCFGTKQKIDVPRRRLRESPKMGGVRLGPRFNPMMMVVGADEAEPQTRGQRRQCSG